jgi:DivIVA domain-containing protein
MWVAPRLTPLDIQNKQFAPAMRGYAIAEVDTFLDELSAQLTWLQQVMANLRVYPQAANELPGRLRQILTVVRRTEFPRVMRGYSIPDVDSFLDEVAYDLQAFLQQIDAAQANATRALPAPERTRGSTRRMTARDIQGTHFTRVLGGYAAGEVDAFMDQMVDVFGALLDYLGNLQSVAAQVRSGYYSEAVRDVLSVSDLPPVTPQSIESQTFSKAVRGYAMYEVDAFLDSLAGGLEGIRQDILQLRQDLAQARPR